MPGVPPNALDNLKRAFKGMFKRGKKNKAGSQQTSSYDTAAGATTSSQVPPTTSSPQSAAPQLPPIGNAASSPFTSPAHSATETSKPLPPTHPLSTGQNEKPPVAVPLNPTAQPGPSVPIAAPAATATLVGTDGVKDDQLAPGRVSPPDQNSTYDGARSGAVSAVEESSQAEEPVKTDSGIEPPKTDAVEEAKPATMEDVPPTPPAKENVPPVTTTTTTTSTTITTEAQPHPVTAAVPAPVTAPVTVPITAPITAPVTNGTNPTATSQPTSAIDLAAEEKVAITMEEPPPIRVVRAAPGMSATSGPLEEFPEGGYGDEH